MPVSGTVSGGDQVTAAQYNNLRLDAIRGLATLGSTLTVTANAITVAPSSGYGFYNVTTSGTNYNKVDTITGGASGDVIFLRAVAEKNIVFDNAELLNQHGTDTEIWDGQVLGMIHDGSNWRLLFITSDVVMPENHRYVNLVKNFPSQENAETSPPDWWEESGSVTVTETYTSTESVSQIYKHVLKSVSAATDQRISQSFVHADEPQLWNSSVVSAGCWIYNKTAAM
jgi:hypothetical protein